MDDSAVEKRSVLQSFMEISGFKTVAFKPTASIRNNYRKFDSVLSFYFDKYQKQPFLGF